MDNYINETITSLLKQLVPYSDKYSQQLKSVLAAYMKDPNGNIADQIGEINEPIPVDGYRAFYSPEINMDLSELFYPMEV